MSRVPLGKVLLRNVIRHTDAHNKIQEESEMWKIRELEKQTEDGYHSKPKRMLPNSSSSRMRSDGFDEESQSAELRARNLAAVSVTMEEDLQHARYWNKKLYEYEANMPDRWGHSGYKELYPEEFDTDRESNDQQEEQNSLNGKRASLPGKRSSLELHKRKKAKKSHKKKRKKKSHKKRKKKKQEPPGSASDTSEESEGSAEVASGAGKRKRKRHKKTKKTSTRPPASSSGPDSGSSKAASDTSSSSADSEPEQKREKQPKKKRRKRHVLVLEKHGDGAQEKRSKRKNWKVAADEKSEDSSDED